MGSNYIHFYFIRNMDGTIPSINDFTVLSQDYKYGIIRGSTNNEIESSLTTFK